MMLIPKKDPLFISWGHYESVCSIIDSKHFLPCFITGMSGNGKSLMIEQACAEKEREYFRVQISRSTDEDDLLGGFRLVKGETVFQYGPVIDAYLKGAVLNLDEVDRGSNALLCLQGVLEGKPILIKKTGEVIQPKEGFNVFATANTKGKGSQDGRYSGATIIDDAFLERFPITLEQPFPPKEVEEKIIKALLSKYNLKSKKDKAFADALLVLVDVIKTTYDKSGINEYLSTRRMVNIIETYSIFKDPKKSVAFCVERFEDSTKNAIIETFESIYCPEDNTKVEPIPDNIVPF